MPVLLKSAPNQDLLQSRADGAGERNDLPVLVGWAENRLRLFHTPVKKRPDLRLTFKEPMLLSLGCTVACLLDRRP